MSILFLEKREHILKFYDIVCNDTFELFATTRRDIVKFLTLILYVLEMNSIMQTGCELLEDNLKLPCNSDCSKAI